MSRRTWFHTECDCCRSEAAISPWYLVLSWLLAAEDDSWISIDEETPPPTAVFF
jgi:hypothetical protein